MSDNATPVRWGVLSTANIGVTKVIPAMQAGSTTRVDAIASRSADRAAETAAALGIPRAYGTYEELLADDEIEAVYIPLPNHLHREWVIAAAEAGKHVLCEKPLAMTAVEAEGMVAACERSGVLLMEAFMYRLHPMWLEVVAMVGSGSIGEVRAMTTTFSYFNDDPTNIRNIPEVGGGALYDIGCYAVNASRLVFGGEPIGVKSSIQRDASFGTDVVTTAILEFAGGTASFVCSTQLEPDQRVVIHGTEGRIVVDIPFNIPPDLPTAFHRVAGGEPPEHPAVETHEFPPADQYTIQGDVFSQCVRTGRPLPVEAGDAVSNLRVIEQILADATS
jgi:predicted dehydrogenase